MKFQLVKINERFLYQNIEWAKLNETTAIPDGFECSNGFSGDEEVELILSERGEK